MAFEDIEDRLASVLPCSAHTWGNEWPEESRDFTEDEYVEQYVRSMKRRGSQVRTTNIRTSWSRSVLRVEDYSDFFVFDLRYEPQPITRHVEEFNESTGARYPIDAPVDLLAAITGFRNIAASDIIEALDRDEHESLAMDLQMLELLFANRVELSGHLSRWMSKTRRIESLETLAEAASYMKLSSLLLESCAVETDPKRSAVYRRHLGWY